MKKLNKGNITNWEIGDCFITQMKSEEFPEYNNYYLIIICCDYYEFSPERKKLYPITYFKLSKKEVKSPKDIDEAEFVISLTTHMSCRFLPFSGLIDNQELIKIREKVKVYPDEYGFLREYRTKIYPKRKNANFIKNCKYIKYENFERPKDEFFHWQEGTKNYYQGEVITVDWFFDNVVRNYEWYNLRKQVYYHLPLEEMQQYFDKSMYPLIVKYKDFIDEYEKNNDPRLRG